MSLTRILRLLIAKRDLDRRLRARKAIRQIRSKASLKGKVTEHRNRVVRHEKMFGASALPTGAFMLRTEPASQSQPSGFQSPSDGEIA